MKGIILAKMSGDRYPQDECVGVEEDMPVCACDQSACNGNAIEEPKRDYDDNSIWRRVGNNMYFPASKTVECVPSGYYGIDSCPDGIFLYQVDVKLNKIYPLPNAATDLLMADIGKFWTLKDAYAKYNRVFRRNYLLYSEPGTGKTSLINLMCKELIEKYNGIVIMVSTIQEMRLFRGIMQSLRSIEPDRKVIVILEDIDNYCGTRDDEGCEKDSELLNILDGNQKFDNTVLIATTNYIGKLSERYTNRPSRFDRVIEFPKPNYESRKIFIEKTVMPEDLERIDINKWVERTEGFTIDHINELILLYFVFGHGEDESFETIEKMNNESGKLRTKKLSDRSSGIGFNTTNNTKTYSIDKAIKGSK